MLLEKIFGFIGSLICHQIPERTLYINGNLLPVCARDTGIYLGIFLSMVFIIVKKRWKADKLPELKIVLLLCFLTIPMMIDGVSSYLGLRTTNNYLRLITGLFFGMPLPLLLITAKNFKPAQASIQPIINSWSEVAFLYTSAIILSLLVYNSVFIPYYLLSSIIILSALFIYYYAILSVTALFNIIRGIYLHGVTVFIWLFAAGLLYMLNKFTLYTIKIIQDYWG